MAESYLSKTLYERDQTVAGDQVFTFSFPYLSESDINVSLNGEDTTDFSFVGDNTIELTNALIEPTDVAIFRLTNIEYRQVDFHNAAELTEKDLDDSASQMFFAVQEAFDKARESITPNPDGTYSMEGRTIQFVADPEDPGDAVNKLYVDAQLVNIIDYEERALQAAQDAEDAAGAKLDINNQAGLEYVLVKEDEADLIRMSNEAENTVVVPANATVSFDIGAIVSVRQVGAGKTTLKPAAGVILRSGNNDLTTDGEEFGLALVKVDTDEWDVVKSFSGAPMAALQEIADDVDQKLTDIYEELATTNSNIESNINKISNLNYTIEDTQGGLQELNFDNQKQENGYQKLPGGLIIQWGRYVPGDVGNGAYFNLPFHMDFPTACLHASFSDTAGVTGGGQYDEGMCINSISQTGLNVYAGWKYWPMGGGLRGTILWFAIGY